MEQGEQPTVQEVRKVSAGTRLVHCMSRPVSSQLSRPGEAVRVVQQ